MNAKYTIVRINGAEFYLHRLMWEMFNGPIPIGYHVHHKDGNPKNNQIDNLECVPKGHHHAHHMREEWTKPEQRAKREGAWKHRKMHAYKCTTCGIDFMSKRAKSERRFCGRKCRNDFFNARAA